MCDAKRAVDAEVLSERKLIKRRLTASSDSCNRALKPRKALQLLVDRGIISPLDADASRSRADGSSELVHAATSPWGGAHDDLARFFRVGVHLGEFVSKSSLGS